MERERYFYSISTSFIIYLTNNESLTIAQKVVNILVRQISKVPKYKNISVRLSPVRSYSQSLLEGEREFVYRSIRG